jgi:surfactin synthase thioesterase subunit
VPNTLWFEHLSRAPQPALQLFCFPYAGGSAQVFRPWQRHLPAHVDLCLVNLPGRGKRMSEPLVTDLVSLVKTIADVFPDEIRGPYALFGHSMGACISFELAHELRRRQKTSPVHLFASGRRAPQVPDTDPVIFNLPHDEFIAELRKLNGTPKELLEHSELMELFLPVIRADFQMNETYEYDPEEPLSIPITAYGGLQDRDVPAETIRAWQELTSSTFKMRMLPGDHFFIQNRSFPDLLARDVLEVVHNLPAPR